MILVNQKSLRVIAKNNQLVTNILVIFTSFSTYLGFSSRYFVLENSKLDQNYILQKTWKVRQDKYTK